MANSLMNVAANTALHDRGSRMRLRSANVSDTERIASIVGGGCLALLGMRARGTAKVALPVLGTLLAYRGLSGYCALYDLLGIHRDGADAENASVRAGAGVKVEHGVTIDRPARELYDFWRQFDRLPRFMDHLEKVTVTGNRSHWVARGPLGVRAEWDAEIINEKPGELIAWRSLPGSDVDTAGSVHFTPVDGGRGTRGQVTMKYDPPPGKTGDWIARLFGESPDQQIQEDLRRFKQLLEVGDNALAQRPTQTPSQGPAVRSH